MTDKTSPLVTPPPSALFSDIRRMIDDARSRVAAMVSTELTLLYWRIGKRINEELLKGERADYGAAIVATVSRQLVKEFGSEFSKKKID
jgi:hypothetical protein